MTYAFTPPNSKLQSAHKPSTVSNSSNNESDVIDQVAEGLRLGFIGCGTIASSIATGIMTQTQISVTSIVVSRRSESKSSALLEKYGDDVIEISDENQHIVDNCDIIFLCVLPEQEEQVLGRLKIHEDKTLVSLVVRLQ